MQPGETIAGRFKLIDRIGAGGMGVVWRGEQTALGRAVAIKVIHHENATAEMKERFQREAELAARVHHRNVIDIVEYGETEDGDQYIVMPLLRGETLATRLAKLPKPTAGEVLGWMRGVLGGLAAIHDEGIVHRDLKPANVFLAEDADGVLPKLLDFGISRTAGRASTNLTQHGTAIGTPQYMAPEQFESSKDLDARADLYGAGAMLYEALTGAPPFDGNDAFGIYRSILSSDPPPLTARRPDLPEALADVVHKALARDAQARFSSAREMREALAAVQAEHGLEGPAAVAHTPAPISASQKLGLAPTASMDTVVPLTQPKKSAERTKDEGRPSRTEAMDVSGEVRRASVSTARTEKQGSKLPWIIAIGVAAGLGVAGIVAIALKPNDPDAIVDTAEAPAAEPADPMGHRVAGPDGLSALALAWAHLPSDLRRIDVRIAESSGSWILIAAPDTQSARVSELAAALGASGPADVAWEADGYTPVIYAANVRINVHADPDRDSPTRRVLLQGALVVGLHGTFDGHVSGTAGDDALMYFIASPNSVGWAVSRFLTPHPSCIPTFDRIATDAGVGVEALEADTIGVRTELALTPGAMERDYVLIARDRAAVRSYVGVYASAPECQLGERRALHTFEGVIDEVFFTDTAPAGESLLMASWSPSETPPSDGVLEWGAFHLGVPEAIWTDRVATAQYLRARNQGAVSGSRDRIVRAQHEPYILAVRQPRSSRVFYRWVDETIVAAEAPANPETPTEDEEAAPPPPPEEAPRTDVPPDPFGQ